MTCANGVDDGGFMRNLIFMLMLALVAVGCNTMQGMGKDIEKAGEAIQRSAK